MVGVGAKQAGFFLGNKIRVVTRKAGHSIKELTLDEAEFEKKFKEFGSVANVYSAFVVDRTTEELESHLPDDEQDPIMKAEMAHHESTNETFTYVVVRMKPEIEQRLRDSRKMFDIPAEMAEIYHFHIFPEHYPCCLATSPQYLSERWDRDHRRDKRSRHCISHCYTLFFLPLSSLAAETHTHLSGRALSVTTRRRSGGSSSPPRQSRCPFTLTV